MLVFIISTVEYSSFCVTRDRCSCGNCQTMASVEENRCCRMYAKIRQLIPVDSICICESAMFIDNCLNPNVLETSRWEYADAHGPFGDEETTNELVHCTGFSHFSVNTKHVARYH